MTEIENNIIACTIINSWASRKHLEVLKNRPNAQQALAAADYIRLVKHSWPKRYRDLVYAMNVDVLINDIFVSRGLNEKTKKRYTAELILIDDYWSEAVNTLDVSKTLKNFMRIKQISSALVKSNRYRARQEKMMDFIKSIPEHRLNVMVGSMAHRDYRAYRYFLECHRNPEHVPKEMPLPMPFRRFAYMPSTFSLEQYRRYLKLLTYRHSLETGVAPTEVAMLFPTGFINHLRLLVERKRETDGVHLPWLISQKLDRSMINLNSEREVTGHTIATIYEYLNAEYSYETTLQRTSINF